MKVLALDTAMSGCSVAFCNAPGECVFEQVAMKYGQAEALAPMAQLVMDKAGAAFADIDLIVTTIGPGAFTGLRIGIAAAQGFGIATGKPVIGVTTLEVLAAMYFRDHALERGQLLCVLIETKREDYYCQFFGADGKEHSEPLALSADRIREAGAAWAIVYIGDALGRFAREGDIVMEGFELPDPCMIASTGLSLFESGKGRAAEPLYLRDADVSKPNKANREILGGGF